MRPRPGRRHVGGRAAGDDTAAVIACTRAHIDQPIARGRHPHLVFGDDHRIARVDQRIELQHEFVDVGRVQSDGRLVDDIQRRAALLALKLGDKLDALGFAAGKFRRRLAEPQVTQADLAQQRRGRADTLGVPGKNPWASSTVMPST